MNVDEAMAEVNEYQKARERDLPPGMRYREIVAITLAKEVERLRVWKTRWKDAAQKLRRQLEESGDGDTWRRACRRVELELEKTHTEVERLRAELAAAKAASVVPVKWKSAEQFFQSGADRGNQWGIELWFDTKEQRDKFGKWIKETGEG